MKMKLTAIIAAALIASTATAKVYPPTEPFWDMNVCEAEPLTTEGIVDPGDFFIAYINLSACVDVAVMNISWGHDGKKNPHRFYATRDNDGARWYPRPDEKRNQEGQLIVKDSHFTIMWRNKTKQPLNMWVTTVVNPR